MRMSVARSKLGIGFVHGFVVVGFIQLTLWGVLLRRESWLRDTRPKALEWVDEGAEAERDTAGSGMCSFADRPIRCRFIL
mmetsp:Transcript_19142/g.27759  ORF Transcript_19142/g.27759 Transcript_19142/m.27759 type:complete len:80 (+) Transcript_19142:452-691(+)